MSKTTNEKREWVYGSTNLDELRDRYNSWANSYDSDLKLPYKKFCFDAADHLHEFLHNSNSPILDIGCGTGLVGERLSFLGYSNLEGIDISPQMLEIARKKNVYTHLQEGDIKEIDSLYDLGYFDGSICVGVFTYGHVKPQSLENIVNVLKVGGVLGFTVIDELFHADAEFQRMIDQLQWTCLNRKTLTVSGESWEDISVYSWVFRKDESKK